MKRRMAHLDSSQCKTFLPKKNGTWEESELDCWALGFSFSLCCNVEQLLGCQITVSTVSTCLGKSIKREVREIALSTSFLLKFDSLKAWSWWEFRLLGRTLFLRALLSRFGCSLSQHILNFCISASHQTGKETRLVQRSWNWKKKITTVLAARDGDLSSFGRSWNMWNWSTNLCCWCFVWVSWFEIWESHIAAFHQLNPTIEFRVRSTSSF